MLLQKFFDVFGRTPKTVVPSTPKDLNLPSILVAVIIVATNVVVVVAVRPHRSTTYVDAVYC